MSSTCEIRLGKITWISAFYIVAITERGQNDWKWGVIIFVCVLVLSVQLCDPMDCSLSCFSVHGVFQARILEQVAFLSPGDLSDPGIKP